MFRVAETSEAMVEHLKATHLHMTPPRFHKGSYLKAREKPSPIRPLFQQSVSPVSFISDKIFSCLSYTVHIPTQEYHSRTLTLHLDSGEHVLPPFASVALPNALALNCGGIITSSALRSVDDQLFIAIGCLDNPAPSSPPASTGSTHSPHSTHSTNSPVSPVSPVSPTVSAASAPARSAEPSRVRLPFPRRSFHAQRSAAPRSAGWLSLYACSASLEVASRLHIASRHGFPAQLCWLPTRCVPAESVGVLAVLWSDGDLEVFPVPRAPACELWIDLEPAARVHFARRITAFSVHPLFGEVVLAGLEDGGLRSVALRAPGGRFESVGRALR